VKVSVHFPAHIARHAGGASPPLPPPPIVPAAELAIAPPPPSAPPPPWFAPPVPADAVGGAAYSLSSLPARQPPPTHVARAQTKKTAALRIVFLRRYQHGPAARHGAYGSATTIVPLSFGM